MARYTQAFVAVILLGSAGTANAVSTPCAALPAGATATVPGPDRVIPPIPGPGGVPTCPGGFTLNTSGPLPRCTQPGANINVATTPQADCYQQMPFNLTSSALTASRPTPSCRRNPLISNIWIRGTNIGWEDVQMTLSPSRDVALLLLSQFGGNVVPADDPFRNNCPMNNCRFVRVTAGPQAPATVQVTLRMPAHAAQTLTLQLPPLCPPTCVTQSLPGPNPNSRSVRTICN